MGMSAGYHLAKQGIRTLLIDAFDPPHQEGSHHGDTRLIRHAYQGGQTYISMAIRAHQLWNELEEALGTSLLIQSGVLNIVSPQTDSFHERLVHLSKFKIPVEILEA